MTVAVRSASLTAAVTRWWWPATGVAVAAAWAGVALSGSSRVPPLAAAAAAGTAALAAAPALRVAGVPGLTSLVALLLLPAVVAEAARGGNAAALGAVMGGVVLLAVFERARARGPSVALIALAVGVAAVVAGLAAGSLDADRLRYRVADRPSAAVVLAGAALVLAAIDHRAMAERAVLAPVLLAALFAVPVLPALAMILGWGALAGGAALLHRPAVALGALAVVAVAAGAGPAGFLLGAGAVLAAALDSQLAAVCGLPGAIVLADALVARGVSAVVVAAGLLLAGTALALALRMTTGQRLDGGRPIALALAGWLVVAPGTWSFTGVDGLSAYGIGASRALATGALVALVVVFRRGAELVLSSSAGEDGEDEEGAVRHPAMATALAASATVLSVGWLVVSVVRLH